MPRPAKPVPIATAPWKKIKESQDLINWVGSTLTEIAGGGVGQRRVMEAPSRFLSGHRGFVVEINKIADQTNSWPLMPPLRLLAGRLAGICSSGREVNKLSQESGSAAKNIAQTCRSWPIALGSRGR